MTAPTRTPWYPFGDGHQRTMTVHGEHLGYSIDAEARPLLSGGWLWVVKRSHAEAAEEVAIGSGLVVDDATAMACVDATLDAYTDSLGVTDA